MRKKTGFRFKQFQVDDSRSAHKVGTDGTLLGAWVDITHAKHILDIGTGSGLIALMLAQRSKDDADIEGVELSQQDYRQALENVHQSPWPKKITLHHSSLQEFQTEKRFDCIVSNPPFFNNSFKPPIQSRVTTRHTDTLPFEDLIHHSRRLLTQQGNLNVILPYTEGLQFMELAKSNAFHLTRQWSFKTRQEKPIERWLLEFSQEASSIQKGELLLYEKDDAWSKGYQLLTRDFYLKLL